jgi:hypothetical protein
MTSEGAPRPTGRTSAGTNPVDGRQLVPEVLRDNLPGLAELLV